jgi:hypothetical protein
MRRAFALAFTAAMGLFALCALTAQAAKVAHLPEEINGRWCIEEDMGEDNQEVFSRRPLTECDYSINFWTGPSGNTFVGDNFKQGDEGGMSASGVPYCEFETVEEIRTDVYSVRANCKGQSGIELSRPHPWVQFLELEIMHDGFVSFVLTYLPEG